jgi:hypothetical protein
MLLLILCACGPSRRRWEPQPIAPNAPSSYAVVAMGTPLFTAPNARAALVAPSLTTLRVIARADGWVELETTAAPTCTPAVLPELRLRVFALERALLSVTQREVVQSFPDGTRVELARGLPLERVDRGSLYRVFAGDLSTIVQLGLGDVGTSFQPSAPFPAARSGRALSRAALAAGVPVVGQTGRVEGTRAVELAGVELRGSEALADVRVACARVIVRVPAHAIEPAVAMQAPPVVSGPHTIRAGTRLFWREGAPAGSVASDVTFARETDPSGARRCFAADLEGRGALDLCVDRRDAGDASPAVLLDPP